MGRKNRKGRSAKQNPRRFYRPKREGEKATGSDDYPRNQRRDWQEVDAAVPSISKTCGRCAEWVSRPQLIASDRGECLHPGSGFTFPTADTKACTFFH